MAIPRSQQISLEVTPYYHCISRCVRRAFLYGTDPLTGVNFSHRKQWLVNRIRFLGRLFALDICAYAVMSNHYHIVVRINSAQAQSWSEEEVIRRWQRLSKHALVPQAGPVRDEAVARWRMRLMNISWFMRYINEWMARSSNKEDGCSGRFWEGRFKSQALLDEKALLTCMSYVDLNPIRAGLSETLEGSDFTSVQERLLCYAEADRESKLKEMQLLPFADEVAVEARRSMLPCLPFYYRDYLALVDWTGRTLRDGKVGSIPSHVGPILERLGINQGAWFSSIKDYHTYFRRVLGSLSHLKQERDRLGMVRLHGQRRCKVLYGETAT